MSIEEEKEFLAPWVKKAATGSVLVVPAIHLAFQERIGHEVPKSTIYRLLARHGWRKVTPDTRHPTVDVAAQEEFKKISEIITEEITGKDKPLLLLFQDKARFGWIIEKENLMAHS